MIATTTTRSEHIISLIPFRAARAGSPALAPDEAASLRRESPRLHLVVSSALSSSRLRLPALIEQCGSPTATRTQPMTISDRDNNVVNGACLISCSP
jgi:hypothetical protein